jgi:SAM-dependent methyltransferase
VNGIAARLRGVEERFRRSAERARGSIARGLHDPSTFRAALVDVPAIERDAWMDLVLGFDELHDDGPGLPPDGVPYLPASVDVLLRMVDASELRPSDVFVDVGSGPGRAAAVVHLLTGAEAIGLEIQPALVRAARHLTARLRLSRLSFIQGDAATLAGRMTTGSVFFLYCPFSGARLAKVLDELEPIARTRTLRLCCVNLPLPPRAWLTRKPGASEDLVVHESTFSSWDGR